MVEWSFDMQKVVYSGLPGCIKSFWNNKCYNFSNLKEFAEDNFKFDENSIKYSRRVENTGKRRNGSLWPISPFPTVF